MPYSEQFTDYTRYIDEVRRLAAYLHEYADQTDGNDPALIEDLIQWFLEAGDEPNTWDTSDTDTLRRELHRIYT